MRVIKKFCLMVVGIVMISSLAGCGQMDAMVGKLKGELLGNDYTINQYDNYGTQVMSIKGDRVSLAKATDTEENISSYIDITIDGHEWRHVGGTLVFYQNEVDIVTDFNISDIVDTDVKDSSTGVMSIDRQINKFANSFGKKRVVIVSSQDGTPLAIFQGDRVYTEIPSDLPKTTLVSIDGKLVYLHRANIDIIDAAMFK